MQSELIVALQEANRAIRGLVSRLSENSVEPDKAVLAPGELRALAEKLAQLAKRLGCASRAQPKQQVPFTSFPRSLSSAKAAERESSSFRIDLDPRFRGCDDDALRAVLSEYVENLETLKGALGKVQDSLGKQRDRLKKDFEHLNSARAWVETFRATNGT
jgi:hypothetical protein